MILTFTPNPSVDSSLALNGTLERGTVHRLRTGDRVAGGKGVNVSHALQLAGYETLAVVPAADNDPFIVFLRDAGIPYSRVAIQDLTRMNTTVTEPDGTTTKLNGPGARLDSDVQAELTERLVQHAPQASWVVLAGSLPPGVAPDWYATLITRLRRAAPDVRIACDTSDAAMSRLAENLPGAAPDLIKPNAHELGQLTGEPLADLEARAATGDFGAVLAAAREVLGSGVPEVLVTLGSAGAVLVTATGAWWANGPAVSAVSTVGAGDAVMAGYLLARNAGHPAADCLRGAVAFGRAAVELPGTGMPEPGDTEPGGVTVSELE